MVALRARGVLFLVGSAVAFVGCGADEEIALLPVEQGTGGNAGAAGTGATGDAGCAQCDNGQVCDRVNGECTTACRSATECSSGERPVCDSARGICVECGGDVNCTNSADSPYCVSGRCVQCRSNVDCTDPQKQYCDRGECHQCLSDEHCAVGESCDPNELQCRE